MSTHRSKQRQQAPIGLKWRSSRTFIVSTVAVGLFTDLFLYALLVPILPYMLREKANVPDDQVQIQISVLLASYAGASVLFSPIAGLIADRLSSRRTPFLGGLLFIILATAILWAGTSMPVLIIGRILQGLSGAVVWTVGLALVMDTVGSENLGKTIGTIFSIISIGDLAAPVISGVIYQAAKYKGVFGVSFAVLGVDVVMRLLVIEVKEAKKYAEYQKIRHQEETSRDNGEEDEETPLLDDKAKKEFQITENLGTVTSKVPLLICLKDPRVLAAFALTLMQATFLGVFDAIIPKRAEDIFGFPPLKSGLIFVPLQVPNLIAGPIAGWAVDKYGTKPAAVFGFLLLAPAFALLRVPQAGGGAQIAIMSVILAVCGIGQAVIGAPSVVEASTLVEKYNTANPGTFGENGPYAQLYGLSSMTFSLGLTLGPLISGLLKDQIGFENTTLIPASLSFATSILALVYIGGPPSSLFKKKKRQS